MRIGLITGEYPPLQGGISAHVDVLARYLNQHGHDVFIFSNDRAKQQHPNIPLENNISKWGYKTNHLINQWGQKHQLDILNLHFQTAAFDMSAWVHFMPHMVEIPFVSTFHDLRFPYLFPKAGKLRDWIVMHLAKASDGVIVTNHEDLQALHGLQSTMIPIGSSILDAEAIDRQIWRQKLGISQDELLLAHFGFINHSKGIDTLLHALASLNNPHIKLLMIGGRTGTADPNNATYADKIDNLISELELKQQIIWTGFVQESEVSAYLETADVLVLPFRDGASFRRSSLMAAIKHACAIVTTRPSVPIPEFSNDNMRLFAPENTNELATIIQALYESPASRDSLRNNARILSQTFDWDTIAQDNVEFFQKILDNK